ncbi:hypothetical protein C5615_14510 [Burkholderia cepacia]|uniref:OmpA-like domain-containing protein n=1 Tax=Burkholderia cepacia TaxID=292 RepID=A0A2S8ITL1_BURCE|nr:hypothetical protein [Burkholderia cepacia]PQP18029.1 hypothetical protein C5615_14510 [Burkholderia cepacia]HDR9507702.1 hypothetical protein [Burkholderia cepacia]
MRHALLVILGALLSLPIQANACKILLTDSMELPLNSTEIANSDRLAVVRHYLTAREWTREGAAASIDATAYDWENRPNRLARQRGAQMKSFLVQLGMSPNDIYVGERIVSRRNGKLDPDDRKQLWVQFVPKCPPAGCQSLCNSASTPGVASYALTPETPGPQPDSTRFSCGDSREPTSARFVTTERWTAHTRNQTLLLRNQDQKPLMRICYRISTSATQYIGMTDEHGETATMQLLGPEYTRIELKLTQPGP